MVTDTQRIKRTDPGRPEVCNVCQLHRFFGADYETIWDGERTARTGCVDTKELLAERIPRPLRRGARAPAPELEARPEYVEEVLRAGADRLAPMAAETMREVHDRMGPPERAEPADLRPEGPREPRRLSARWRSSCPSPSAAGCTRRWSWGRSSLPWSWSPRSPSSCRSSATSCSSCSWPGCWPSCCRRSLAWDRAFPSCRASLSWVPCTWGCSSS